MLRAVKLLVAILLLPVCLGASEALFWVLVQSGRQVPQPLPSLTWLPLLFGAVGWGFVYLTLPKPMLIYVFGHELTHVIWGWLFEAKLKRFKVSARGGQVVLSHANFLIILAPYFFPLYALVVMGLYAVVSLFGESDWSRSIFLLLLGATYAFHITLTWHALQSEQTDITSQGTFFSMVVIWLGNVIVLLLLLPPVVQVPMRAAFERFGSGTWFVVRGLGRLIGF